MIKKEPDQQTLFKQQFGAGNEVRTRDPDLGKVVLYQLSYSRIEVVNCIDCVLIVNPLVINTPKTIY